MEKKEKEAQGHFIEQMGIVAQADGLPRIAGRLMGLMVIEGGPFSFTELAERLQVSRGSISTNSRLLENLGVIERVSMPGDRQDYFQLSPKPYINLLEGVVRRMNKAHDLVLRTQGALIGGEKDTQNRLRDLGKFYKETVENTQGLIRRFRES